MFEHERVVYAMNLGLLQALVKDLTPAQMVMQVTPATNPPVWILGHLATASDGAGQVLGLERVLPEAWHQQFGMGSKPMPTLDPMPTKDELMRAIESAHERVTAATRTVEAGRMAQPHGLGFLEGTPVKTIGEAIALIMTMHEGFHVGQLSYCRRQMGFAPMF